MKIVLFSRPQINHTVEDLRRLLNLIDHYGFDYAINQEFAAVVEQKLGIVVESEKIYGDTTGAQPAQSVMVCCGGDGTLLEGIHRLSDKTIPVAGINFGHLGFLTSATRDGVESLFEQIANRGGEGVSRDVCLSIVEGAVEQVTIAGKPIDDNRYYNIATLNFLAYGGDGLVAFTRGEVIHEYAGDVYNIFASYVRNLTAQGKSMSATTDGRVTIQ